MLSDLTRVYELKVYKRIYLRIYLHLNSLSFRKYLKFVYFKDTISYIYIFLDKNIFCLSI